MDSITTQFYIPFLIWTWEPKHRFNTQTNHRGNIHSRTRGWNHNIVPTSEKMDSKGTIVMLPCTGISTTIYRSCIGVTSFDSCKLDFFFFFLRLKWAIFYELSSLQKFQWTKFFKHWLHENAPYNNWPTILFKHCWCCVFHQDVIIRDNFMAKSSIFH